MTLRAGAWLLLAGICAAGAAAAESGSRYERTLRVLERAEAELRTDFAGIALGQLTGAYRAEADLARQELQSIATNPKANRQAVERAQQKNRHWSSSVDQYAGRLLMLQRRVEAGAAVDFILSPVTETVLVVDGEQVVLAHPRPGKQKAFEQSVLDQFCELRDCAALTGPGATASRRGQPGTADTGPVVVDEDSRLAREASHSDQTHTDQRYNDETHPDQPDVDQPDIDHSVVEQSDVEQSDVEPAEAEPSDFDQPVAASTTLRPGWEFSAQGMSCTYGGIRLRFMGGDNSGAVRRLCTDLFAEIAALREGLLQQQKYGVLLEVSELAFNPMVTDDGQTLLRLNRSGDLLRVPVPLLQAHPAVLLNLVPWLDAQLAGESATLELQAGYYGWEGRALDRWR